MKKIILIFGCAVVCSAANAMYRLHDAVMRADKALVESLSHRYNVNQQLNDGSTLLWQAVYDNHPAIVKILLEAGADVNALSGEFPPLNRAVSQGNTELVKILLDAGANVFQKDRQGWTSVQLAYNNDHKEIVRLLNEHIAHSEMTVFAGARHALLGLRSLASVLPENVLRDVYGWLKKANRN